MGELTKRNLNGETLRIELSAELMLNFATGRSYEANAVRILAAEETSSGRTKWVDVVAEQRRCEGHDCRRAPIVSTEGKKPGECSYADLLGAVARIIEASGASSGEREETDTTLGATTEAEDGGS